MRKLDATLGLICFAEKLDGIDHNVNDRNDERMKYKVSSRETYYAQKCHWISMDIEFSFGKFKLGRLMNYI